MIEAAKGLMLAKASHSLEPMTKPGSTVALEALAAATPALSRISIHRPMAPHTSPHRLALVSVPVASVLIAVGVRTAPVAALVSILIVGAIVCLMELLLELHDVFAHLPQLGLKALDRLAGAVALWPILRTAGISSAVIVVRTMAPTAARSHRPRVVAWPILIARALLWSLGRILGAGGDSTHGQHGDKTHGNPAVL